MGDLAMPDSGRGHQQGVAGAPPSSGPLDVRAVYREHADFVWRSLARLGVRPDDLTDMTQEVFLIVHRQASSWRPESQITTWLYGICRKVASSYRRRAHRRYEDVVAEPPEPPAIAEGGPDARLANQQARAQLDAILSELNADQRAVFVMFEIDEMSCEAIATETGVPLGTVFSRLRAARKAFERGLTRWQAREGRRSK